ncbi:hypothetical protein AcV5_007706 [Taiwanofungus camphoratus]|nr:hypothetical protein AcW2_007372 [Antrodia cinnamomea]KAI0927073.1 hypothetical protein AcV5_007706 [Antrodia cinnamomea]
MNDELAEGRIYATFEKYGELLDIQKILLSLDPSEEPSAEEDRGEDVLLRKLSEILNEYQEQAYLLDPFIEELVTPVVEKLKNHAKASVTSPDGAISGTRVGRIALLLYNYIKFRGYKTITRFFPHEIADLSIALDYVLLLNGNTRGSSQDPSQWSLRYVVLLWLSLICMIPFDLEQFDDRDNIGDTSAKLESLGKSFLSNAGLERDGASILLSRLYMRKDTSAKLLAFLKWSIHTAQCQSDPFSSIGMLQVLCELTKSGSAEKIQAHVILLLDVAVAIKDNATLMANTVVRKLRTKLVSRVVLRRLPAVISAARIKGRALSSRVDPTTESLSRPEDDDFDVPEETESVLEELFEALQDKDTIVRWSAAKGIARISERLPAEFAQQVLDTIIGLFSIHSIAAATIYDMPSIAESTWHGTCLACAEMARRGLVADEKLPELVDWLCKALYFDIRKGAHSVGSNVRDAASYVLWSLARAQSPSALAPHAQNLAQRLVAVSLFDREIHIRRAASATFQEYVGRTSLFPHGIDVLRKTDFYAVGVRRNAFLVAAPEVAEHDDYQSSLIDHLLTITLRHWDPTMRQLGAQSLRAICELDLPHLGPSSAERAAQLLKGSDTGDIHGALLTLTELATAYRDSGPGQDLHAERRKIFAHWSDVPLNIVQSPRHELVTAAACCLIANSISPEEIQLTEGPTPNWRRIVDFGLKSKSAVVQEAAATAMASVSKLVDCSAVVQR